jgi:hypothetical protein
MINNNSPPEVFDMRGLRLIVATFALAAAVRGQNQTSTPAPAPQVPATTAQAQPLPFGTQIRKTVLFIELQCKRGGDLVPVTGTGFLVGIAAPELGKDVKIGYLVTNRHVALCWDEQRQALEVKSVSVRANLKDGSSVNVPLNPSGNITWTLPKDNSVDLAVTPITVPSSADAILIPLSMFATREVMSEQKVVEGSRIVFTGFFYQFPGERRIQPIVREGILAMVPDEPLKNTTGLPGTVYLGDVHIFHGNSGSPVFVDVQSGFGPPNYRFLGVVSGNFSEDQDFNLEVDTTIRGTTHANSGIALIVPADAVKSLIEDDPILKAGRESAIKAAHGQAK